LRIWAAIAGSSILALVLVDAFNTIVLARRTQHIFRIARAYYKLSWRPFAAVARRIRSSRSREAFLGVFAPLSLLMLFAIWAVALVLAFALLQWSAHLQPASMAGTFGNDLYLAAGALFTLDSGDPVNPLSKALAVTEGGLGLAFLGLVVGYLPVFYESFSTRELRISLLDARAGSPPSAGALLQSAHAQSDKVERQLEIWEEWAAQVLENHLSFPMLAYFRSQHSNQSWLTALVAILDYATIVSLCAKGDLQRQAKLTFAMGRHVLTDMAVIFALEKQASNYDGRSNRELRPDDVDSIREILGRSNGLLDPELLTEAKVRSRRKLYEGQATALGEYFLMALPSWIPDGASRGNWRVSLTDREEVPFAVSDPFAETSSEKQP